MAPQGKKRRVEDRDYGDASNSYVASAPTTSRGRALAENKAALAAEKAARMEEQGRHEAAHQATPLIDMSELPPSAIHAYIRHYNLVPLPLPLPQSLPASVPAPINYTQAVFPTPAQSATPFERAGPGGGPPVEAEEGLDVLKTPAWDGQEVGEADQRLQEMAREHWDSVSLKEGETIVNFVYALRMKNKHIKMPTPA